VSTKAPDGVQNLDTNQLPFGVLISGYSFAQMLRGHRCLGENNAQGIYP